MANFSFVSGAKFRPFSYSEMLAPLQQATTAQMQIEDAYGELGTKADVFERMANEQTDPQAYAIYKQYSNDLAKQAESLAKQGLTPASRQGLIDMKRRYSSEIVPIEQAYKRRQELIDEQRKLQAQDSTLLFDRPASTLSLDELIANPALSPQSYSGALLSKQVGTAAQNLAKEVRENPRKWRTILGNQYYETIMQKGFRPDEIMQAVQNNPEASPILQGIVEDAIGSSGIRNWNDENILNRAYDYARQGLWNAVGETQYQTLSNKAYDYAMQERLAQARKKGTKEDVQSPYFRSSGVTKVKDVNVEKKKDDIAFIQGVRNGTINLDETAQRVVGSDPLELYGTRGHLQRTPGKVETYKPNQERISNLMKEYGIRNLDQIEAKINSDLSKSAMREVTYITSITDPTLISKTIRENAASISRRTDGKSGIYELDSNKKGDMLSYKDIKDYFNEDSQIEYDPNLGIVFTGTNSKGDTKNFLLDPEVVAGETKVYEDGIRRNVIQNQLMLINQAIENEDVEAQRHYITELMNDIYSRFNSIAKRESNTDSNI
nr:MAG TPA: hypothetical protein [Caudoviricetes sp.]